MKNVEAQNLLDKYNAGKANAAEKEILERWYLQHEPTAEFPAIEDLLADQQRSKEMLMKEINTVRKVTLWPKIAVVAAALAAVIFGIWFYNAQLSPTTSIVKTVYHNDIAPGRNTATLTLADGKTVTLSDAKAGVVISDKSLTYSDGTQIAGIPGNTAGSKTATQLIAGTPRGGTYQAILPDGTKVWLNAASSLKFPSSFSGQGKRRVFLTGEAYFEVAKLYISSKKKNLKTRIPFIVITDRQEVEVLGTHFNINSYADEQSTKTTLLEGSVLVHSPKTQNSVVLRPGQQAVAGNTDFITVQAVNTDQSISWKNGYFRFNNESIQNVMKELSRWYDIDVEYQGAISQQNFNGKISRNTNISEVLNALESTKSIHFKIEGRRVTVIK